MVDSPVYSTYNCYVYLQTEEGTIRLFEREANGSIYYTFHGEDAEYVAKNVYETTSVLKYWFGKN